MFDLKVGDIVVRDLCGSKMDLTVTDIDDKLIHCGAWTFSKETGCEVDEDLGWDGITTSGSRIFHKTTKERGSE